MYETQMYQQQQIARTTRIELLLALYDKAIQRLHDAQSSLEQADLAAAAPSMLQAQMIVYALASGVDTENQDCEATQNTLRLFEFVLYCLSFSDARKVGVARRVLTTLREGFERIGEEATTLELAGKIPALKATAALRATA